ncbi:hypothetical protein ON010_g5768 [Phytophthora cinnamomi]|nr:hypothetical protein ON010_g5768 [Phytophthora cinnamomi]
MGCGKTLTSNEYWWIIDLYDGGVSFRDIARRTRRSLTCVRTAIKTERGPATESGGGKRRPLRNGAQDAALAQGFRANDAAGFAGCGSLGVHQDGPRAPRHGCPQGDKNELS